jgi:site-specific DNA recombinase
MRRQERQNGRGETLRPVRCAIYCRKSNTEGLDGDFSSLDAQREACTSYIQSQAGLGWVLVPERYEDGGFSGGNMERPALKRLLADVEQGLVDCIVLYRLDRLSRSLVDFAKIVEILEARSASFVSVTESFSTATSTGRLHLHMILAFAQYERELAAERIRDKIAGAKRRGKYCGGPAVLGFGLDRSAKRLVVNAAEAKLVRRIFERFCVLRSTLRLAKELNAEGHLTKQWTTSKGVTRGGRPWVKADLYHVLNNPLYTGQVPHRGQLFPGQHERIVSEKLWREVQAVLAENHRARANQTRSRTEALLRGVLRCAHCDAAMGPTFTRKRGRTYRYYLCSRAGKHGYSTCPVRTVAAGPIEAAVIDQLRRVFRSPEVVTRTFREAQTRQTEEVDRLHREKGVLEERMAGFKGTLAKFVALKSPTRAMAEETKQAAAGIDEAKERLEAIERELGILEKAAVTEAEVIKALAQLDGLWAELFPAERARIVALLVARVDVRTDAIELRLRGEGLRSLVAEVGGRNGTKAEATA